MSAIRLLHYANFLSGFDYDIQYRPTKEHSNADFLSRFPVDKPRSELSEDETTIFQIKQMETLPITQKEIRAEVLKDDECRQYFNALQLGKALPHGANNGEFSLENGCIFKGIRVMIPKSLQKRVLDELHIGHAGIVRMKSLARSYVWWRGIDRDIEVVAKKCYDCCKYKNMPQKEVPHPWEYPAGPWQRIHIDFAGPFIGTYILIVVDAYSKWVEAIPTYSLSSTKTIKILREIFARFGLPLVVVSDNGTSFTSQEFREFIKTNGICHKFSAPYHPASNGQVERYVATIKAGLRSMFNEKGDIDFKLCKLLMQYRKIPNATTGDSPAELMLKRTIRTRIDLVKSDVSLDSIKKQNVYREPRKFVKGDLVQVRFYNNKVCKWKFGIVLQEIGSRLYKVLIDNEEHIRHIDQMRSTECVARNTQTNYNSDLEPTSSEKQNIFEPITESNACPTTDLSTTNTVQKPQITTPSTSCPPSSKEPSSTLPIGTPDTSKSLANKTISSPVIDVPISPQADDKKQSAAVTLRRSERVRRAPQRLDL